MQTLDIAANDIMVSLDDLRVRGATLDLEQGIQTMAASLTPGGAKQINIAKAPYSSIGARLTKMKKAGKLPDEIILLKRGEKVFLGRLKATATTAPAAPQEMAQQTH